MPHHTKPPPVFPPVPPDPPDPPVVVAADNQQINDAIMAVVGPAINEGLLAYYQANGATSGDMQDAELQFLLARVEVTVQESLQDMWHIYLGARGFTGSLDDRRLAFWVAGGIP